MKNNKLFKILVKDHFDKSTDIVSRGLNRGFGIINDGHISGLSDSKGSYIYGYIENDKMYEFFTNNLINVDNSDCIFISSKEVTLLLESLTEVDITNIRDVINGSLFSHNDLFSTMRQKSNDRYNLFNEYNNDLSDINPYSKEHMYDYDMPIIAKQKVKKLTK